MEYMLKELHMGMGRAEWEMYQDIPVKEPGATNLCRGLPFEVFPSFLEGQIARNFQTVSPYDTPTATYLFYADGRPVGYIGIRTKIDENWRRWSGNVYYAVRMSERGKGRGTKILALALEECRKNGHDPGLCQRLRREHGFRQSHRKERRTAAGRGGRLTVL